MEEYLRFQLKSHRHADILLESSRFSADWHSLTRTIKGISGAWVSSLHTTSYPHALSVSYALNDALKIRLGSKRAGWKQQVRIFAKDDEPKEPVLVEPGGNPKNVRARRRRSKGDWTLDFRKGEISVEAAFNHGEAAAWNLIKPLLASEVSHLRKALKTEIGVVITVTDAFKQAGRFDTSVGTFEKYCSYLDAFTSILTVPVMLIGLETPRGLDLGVRKKKERKLQG